MKLHVFEAIQIVHLAIEPFYNRINQNYDSSLTMKNDYSQCIFKNSKIRCRGLNLTKKEIQKLSDKNNVVVQNLKKCIANDLVNCEQQLPEKKTSFLYCYFWMFAWPWMRNYSTDSLYKKRIFLDFGKTFEPPTMICLGVYSGSHFFVC